jgi:hypothetical protein
MITRILSTLLFISLASCNLPGATAPTAAVPTEPISTLPAATEAPTSEPEQLTATAPSIGQALEAIVILSPGANSLVSSPIIMLGQSRPTFEQALVVAVFAEDGSELARQPATIDSPSGEPGNFTLEIPFSVAVNQPGRISVFETSAMDGGIVHLTSVEVTLLTGGTPELQTPAVSFESIDIQSPAPMAEISGGVISVSGFSDYYFESNLGLILCGGGGSGAPDEICGTEDNILAQGNAMIDAADVGQPGPFSGQLTYSVSQQTPARIVVFAASPRDGGLLHLNSIPILLLP